MKKLKQSILIISLLITTTVANAQLNGLLKKAKDKIIEKKLPTNKKNESDEQQQNKLEDQNQSTIKTVSQTKNKDTNLPEDYYIKNNPLGKIYFDNKPFTTSPTENKAVFKTNEFIYGRLQLTSGTIKEAFKIDDLDKKTPFQSIKYVVHIYKKGVNKYNNYALWDNCLISDADLAKNYFDFDVLPDPQKAATVISALPDFSAGKSSIPLYNAISPQTFDEDGLYKVNIYFTHSVNDAWGKPLKSELWPVFETDFDLEFSSNDIATLKKNSKLASENAENNMQNLTTAAQELPKQWNEKTAPMVMGYTQSELIAMYQNSFTSKMDPHTVIKLHSSSSSGGWTVQNNEYGIPIYRYSNQWYTIFVKYSNGGNCYFQGFGLRQQYNGGGTYGKAFIDKNNYYLIDCAKFK